MRVLGRYLRGQRGRVFWAALVAWLILGAIATTHRDLYVIGGWLLITALGAIVPWVNARAAIQARERLAEVGLLDAPGAECLSAGAIRREVLRVLHALAYIGVGLGAIDPDVSRQTTAPLLFLAAILFVANSVWDRIDTTESQAAILRAAHRGRDDIQDTREREQNVRESEQNERDRRHEEEQHDR
jgi:hypothetical protein